MAAMEHVRCYLSRLVGGFSVAHSIAAHITMDLERLSVGSQIPQKSTESVNWQFINHHWAPRNPSFCFYDSDAVMDTQQGCVVFMREKGE